ncbi:MAG: aminoglycoside phosphotransferase family protein [Chloroflexi bacterium]|nr:aminoglycoside phosphotransferase family protein [Chloroflexota bacterium]
MNPAARIELPIPGGPDAITPEWLTAALRHSNASAGATVKSLKWTPLKRGRLSRIVRIHPEFAPGGTTGPRSIIAKFHPLNPASRGPANAFAKSETGFYKHFAERSELRTPLCHYGRHDPESSRFVLLIEDLEANSRRFEGETCTPSEAKLALRNLAAFQAASWDRPGRGRPAFLERLDDSKHTALQGAGLPALLAENPPIDPESRVSAEREFLLVRNRLSRPPLTIVLDDVHVGNLFQGLGAGMPVITFIDFQFVCLARGPLDVARLLAGSLAPDTRRAVEMRLLRAYHDALTSGRVVDYSIEDCLRDYRLGLLWGLLRLLTNNLVMKAISVDAPPDARTELAHQIERFSAAVDDLDCRELLRD